MKHLTDSSWQWFPIVKPETKFRLRDEIHMTKCYSWYHSYHSCVISFLWAEAKPEISKSFFMVLWHHQSTTNHRICFLETDPVIVRWLVTSHEQGPKLNNGLLLILLYELCRWHILPLSGRCCRHCSRVVWGVKSFQSSPIVLTNPRLASVN